MLMFIYLCTIGFYYLGLHVISWIIKTQLKKDNKTLKPNSFIKMAQEWSKTIFCGFIPVGNVVLIIVGFIFIEDCYNSLVAKKGYIKGDSTKPIDTSVEYLADKTWDETVAIMKEDTYGTKLRRELTDS